MSSFKSLFGKPVSKTYDKDSYEAILEICREIYSQHSSYSPEDLLKISSDLYLNKEMEVIRNKISDSSVYLLDVIKEKFPPKELNKIKEDIKK
jgi:hypothetical protein